MTAERGPLLACPRGRDAPLAGFLSVVFGVVFVVFYGGASAVSGWVPYRIRIDLPFEAKIPFVPQAAAVYLTVVVLVGCAPFVLRQFRELFPFFVALCFEAVIGALFFVLLPVEPGYAANEAVGPLSSLFALADLLNLERNEFPALHVAFAFTAAAAYRSRCGPWTRVAFWLWAAAIAASTLLVHEHHLFDMGAGIALAGLTMVVIHPLARRPAFLESAEIESLCLIEFARCARRHVRYLVICVALYRASVGRFRERCALRTGFCVLQSVDDLLDGDRSSNEEPLDVVDGLVEELRSRRFGDGSLSRLAAAFLGDCERAGRGPDALAAALALIRHMQADRRRILECRLLGEQQLREHHRRTFGGSVDLMLLTAGSPLRAADVPDLIDAFGWCSTMRDLEEDLDNGLVNIPKEIVERARDEGVQDLSFASLCRSSAVRDWMKRELARAEEALDRADAEIRAAGGAEGASTLGLFARSIRRYARRYSRALPGASSLFLPQ